jgi:hypothetical protein
MNFKATRNIPYGKFLDTIKRDLDNLCADISASLKKTQESRMCFERDGTTYRDVAQRLHEAKVAIDDCSVELDNQIRSLLEFESEVAEQQTAQQKEQDENSV